MDQDRFVQDIWIQETVMQQLVAAPCLDTMNLQVNVRGGVALLRGWVDSAEQAEAIVRHVGQVPGVVEVRSEIEVSPRPTYRSDEELTRAVIHAISQDADIKIPLIQVVARQGDVLITGWVGTPEQNKNAEGNAWWTAGVLNVINHLQVGDEEHPDDETIARTLLNELIHSPRIDSRALKLAIDHGVVTLSGTVPTAEQLEAVVEIVRTKPGVVGVVNQLGTCQLTMT